MNCWRKQDGSIVEVAPGMHAANRPPRVRSAIRVSTPEGRRTWAGVECTGMPTLDALRTLKRMIRDLDGSGIVAELAGRRAEAWGTRPRAIHNLINTLIGELTHEKSKAV